MLDGVPAFARAVRRIIFPCLVLTLAVLTSIAAASCAEKDSGLGRAISEELAPISIPAGDWYTPAEPELLPPVILARERAPWKAEDLQRFWTDPATLDQSALEAASRAAIEELLRKVP